MYIYIYKVSHPLCDFLSPLGDLHRDSVIESACSEELPAFQEVGSESNNSMLKGVYTVAQNLCTSTATPFQSA